MKANILLEGPTGTGKTFAARTLLPHFRRVVVLAHEQGFWNTFNSKPIAASLKARIKYRYLAPAKPSWATLIDNARKINTLPNDTLQKMPGLNKQDYMQFIELLTLLSDFTTDDGEKLGPADSWGPDTCLFQDGLSGLNRMSIDLVCGAKPIKTQPDWGVGMDNLENFIQLMTTGLNCSYVLISHIEREPNEITGVPMIGVQTLGRKLAPKLPQKFDEVILAKRVGSAFMWSTSEPQVDLKTRLLPLQENLPADFGLIFKENVSDASTAVHQESKVPA